MHTRTPAEFVVERDEKRCIGCGACVTQCAFETHLQRYEDGPVLSDDRLCVGCHRCEAICPAGAIRIARSSSEYRENASWSRAHLRALYRQADTGGVMLAGMGNPRGYRIYWDHLVLDASQVTNPSIDPLREPMELRTCLGRKPDALELGPAGKPLDLRAQMGPQLELSAPVMFSAMSYGAVNFTVCAVLARAATELGTYWNTGEGGLPQELYRYGAHTIVQCASGRFGVSPSYLAAGAAVEIKIGQGAKPGIGGHLPGEKVNEHVAHTRMIPVGSDALSPAPHHDIYSIEDLRQLIFALKEAVDYQKPVGVKIAAVHNSAAIASGIVRAGADFVAVDGFRGGTGAAPMAIRDNVGIPIELALAAIDDRLRAEGIRNRASLIVAGGIRSSADVVKAIALGADAVYIGTAALVAMGCALCERCFTGKCNWGICTNRPDLAKRLHPDAAFERVTNLVTAWSHEIQEMLGGMGINAIESLRGNRLRLRAIGLSDREMEILGVLPAGL